MKVNIQNLKDGLHFFEFKANVEDFRLDRSNLKLEQIDVKSKVHKSEHNIVVTSNTVSKVELICDNCLDEFTSQLEDTFSLFYTAEKVEISDDDELRYISSGTRYIDLSDGVRDSILLSLPMRQLCCNDCKGLCAQCGVNLNHENCRCQKTIDPRWEGLRKLTEENTSAKLS